MLMGTLLWSIKKLFINKVATWFLRVLTCANCIATNHLQRKTRAHQSEVSHVLLPSSLLLRAKLIVLFITYSFSGSVDQNDFYGLILLRGRLFDY